MTGPQRPTLRRRQMLVLFGGCLVALAALAFWHPLQQEALAFFLLHSESPASEVLQTTVDQANDPTSLLANLWKSGRIPHRQFVLGYLSTASTTKPALVKTLEAIVLEATADPDITTREFAFTALARIKHPRLRPLALEQLSDADPAARLIALQNLRTIATSNDVPLAIRMLDDPEPRVVVAAALLLRQATGRDFGIKSSHAIPQFTCIDTDPPPAPDLPAISQGVQHWHEWWSAHQAAYVAPFATTAPIARAAGLPAPNFTLDDPAGKPVRLAAFRGKSVLLAFWSPGAPASLDDAAALNTLQQRNLDGLAILGICTLLPPSCADEHGDSSAHDHAHHHHGGSATTAGAAAVTGAIVQDAAERLHIRFPMLLDPQGKIALRYAANEFPAYVLIDPQGFIRRRIVGFRTESVLAGMVEAVAAPKMPAALVHHDASH